MLYAADRVSMVRGPWGLRFRFKHLGYFWRSSGVKHFSVMGFHKLGLFKMSFHFPTILNHHLGIIVFFFFPGVLSLKQIQDDYFRKPSEKKTKGWR